VLVHEPLRAQWISAKQACDAVVKKPVAAKKQIDKACPACKGAIDSKMFAILAVGAKFQCPNCKITINKVAA